LPEAKAILESFDEEIQTACIGSISECFEGDPPFRAKGCLSQATSVGGLLHISSQIDEWKKKVAKKCKAEQKTEQATEEPAKAKRCCVRKKK
jgi:glycogen debranching enzyme